MRRSAAATGVQGRRQGEEERSAGPGTCPTDVTQGPREGEEEVEKWRPDPTGTADRDIAWWMEG